MDADFWKSIWEEGKIGFHQGTYHEKLLHYFSELKPSRGQNVFVPLCGKTKDMVWLHGQGLNVFGIELHAPAIRAFYEENGHDEDIKISCGDFFKITEECFYDLVYDRASIVALPEEMRKDYAQVITRVLKKGGRCLLIGYEYDSAEIQGPPFSVTEKEIRTLYEKNFSVKLLERERPKGEAGRLSSAPSLYQTVYLMEKLS